jgi:plastocyanin
MIYRWLIFFSLILTQPALAGQVSGRVTLSDSRDPGVRNHRDYSDVVISLKALAAAPAGPLEVRKAVEVKKAVILQKNKMFSPHVLAIPVGSIVEFPNADPIFHNAFSSYNGQIFDVGLYPPGTTRSVHFAREGVVRVFCNIHSSMSAMIVVLGTPYYATTRKDGSFSITDVPPGDYAMTLFHERATEATLAALARRVTVGAGVGAENVMLPGIVISEAGFLSIPHKNKYGRDYALEPPSEPVYPEVRH